MAIPQKRARILHVLTNLDLGGAQTSVVEICSRLIPLGYEVHLAFSSRGGAVEETDPTLLDKAGRAGVSLHDIPRMRRAIRPFRDLAAYTDLVGLMRQLQPDVVHTHMSKAGLLGRLAAARAEVPVIIHSVRGWSFYGSRSGPVQRAAVYCERIGARQTKAMLAVSEAALRDGVSREIGASHTYRVVRSGIDLQRFSSHADQRRQARRLLDLPENVPLVGGVMRLCAQKSPRDFVEVARRVSERRDDVRFAVIGDGPFEPSLKKLIAERGLERRFRLFGRRLDLELLYPAFDLLLITSHWEGLPRVAVEAIGAGVPVIAASVGGCSEVVIPGRTGLLAAPGDLEGLSAQVLAALGNRDLIAAIRAHGPTVLAPFDLDYVVTQHHQIYCALLERKELA